ncbi:MAG: T9SS type A sorting domain-containing protein, partial [Bacteroidetes bacterium]|nr:T9SS type A sorting domain-containing protein [Bacteroidota bacterium]
KGLAYWNENRPTFSDDMDALCPYSDCGYSELVEDYSLIGWAQDINENGTWDILGEVGAYYVGASSQPQIHVDNMTRIYVVWAAITETYNNGTQDYRHLWARYSPNGDWWANKFVDLTSDLIHIFDECVFPSIASTSDDENFWLVYQTDNEPGLAVRGDQDPYTDNTIRIMKVAKADVEVGVKENNMPVYDYDVLQNYPNPASGMTTVKVNIRQASEVSLSVINIMGQKVLEVAPRTMHKGMNEITFDVSDLANGTYFYVVTAGDASVSKKMLVE